MSEKDSCDHVWMRTEMNRRICGYCNLAQTGSYELVWRDDKEIGHKLVHLRRETGELVYDQDCEYCRLKHSIGEK